MIASILGIAAIILLGAGLLTMMGIVVSLGHYDIDEVRAKYNRRATP